MQTKTTAYIELTKDTYSLILDTLASATRSRVDYWKTAWDIVSRPYASTAFGPAAKENADRATELAGLTIEELRSRVERGANFSEKILAQAGKLQDAALETYREAVKSTSSAVEHIKTEVSETAREAEHVVALRTYRGASKAAVRTPDEGSNGGTELTPGTIEYREAPDHVSSN